MADEKPKKPAKEPKGEKADKPEKSAGKPAAAEAPAKGGKPGGPGKGGGKAPEGGEPPKPAEPVAGAVAPTAAELLGDDANAKKIVKAKGAKNIAVGIAHILATFNNTQVTITYMQGNLFRCATDGRA